MNRKLIISILLTVSASSFAGGWTDFGKITRLYPHGLDNTVYMKMDVPIANPQNSCSAADWYALSGDTMMHREIYSHLLAAQKTGKKVRLYLDGCRHGRPSVVASMDE